ncbi:hypothetical protein [Curtobacterium sp. MCBD17_040]|uniref:hypothetical protein n=1 Tax=Curtobacterium sp. MCBD17_040 TaxID=2175674 RepID=UPI0011B3E0E2|nr:hypothetical protein [Curtobacterium sp. MCBD17_040]WIB65623.1 hypothetical protein DEI94_16010 [Curtobacterium sp. MCBD17_040]
MQQPIAPPLVRDELLRAMTLIDVCRAESGARPNFRRPAQTKRSRRRLFELLDQPDRATWRMARTLEIYDGQMVTLRTAVQKYTDYQEISGEPPTREQLFFTLETVAANRS